VTESSAARPGDGTGALLVRGARILTPEPAPAGHDALAVVDGRIVAVGPEAACRAALPAGAAELDVAGRTVVPGLVDAHTHPLVMSVFEQHLRFDDATTLADVLDAVADRARTAEPGATVIGFQLDDARLAERRLPTGDELDRAGAGHPVVLIRRDGHHAVGSTAAIVAAGLDDPAAVPAGGHVERDAAGRPTGLVGETAVAGLMALMPEITLDDLAAGAASWGRRLLTQGVTGLSAICQTTAEGPSGPAGELEALGWSVLAPTLPFDVQTILIAPDLAAVDEWRAVPALHDPAGRRRVDAVKLFLDGTLGGATACMHAPFADRTHTSGMRTLGDDDAYRRMVAAHTAGLQVCIHAIGDAANRAAADLFARLLAEHPGPHRHRVEHASVLDAATVDAFATLGITCVVQPISLRTEDHWLADRLGADRLARAYPFRTLHDAGVVVAGSSDAPIEPTDPWAAMAAAVDRRGLADAEALTPVEALGLSTTGAAWARNVEADQGRLAPGHRADLVVLDGDPLVDGFDAVTVEATAIDGRFHHVAPALSAAVPPALVAPGATFASVAPS
jgi:predicted amidohydrolase YtcJ